MALIKNISTDYGVDATYHNVGSVQVDFRTRALAVTGFSYVDEAAHKAGKQPLAAFSFTVTKEGWQGTDPTREDVYKAMLTLPQFTDAINA